MQKSPPFKPSMPTCSTAPNIWQPSTRQLGSMSTLKRLRQLKMMLVSCAINVTGAQYPNTDKGPDTADLLSPDTMRLHQDWRRFFLSADADHAADGGLYAG